MKYLGLIIDNFVSEEMVVNNILSKVNARLKCMYRHSSSLSSRARKKLVFSPNLMSFRLFLFLVEWLVLPNALRKKIQIAQNKVIRFINFLGPRSRVTADTLGESNLLNVETLVKQLRLIDEMVGA